MIRHQLTEDDKELIKVAKQTLAELYEIDRHEVSSAVRTGSGEIYSGVQLYGTTNRAAICAEAIALGKSVSAKERVIDTIVAVKQSDPNGDADSMYLVSPCGVCRELIHTYGSGEQDTMVIVKGETGPEKYPISDLLPIPD